MDYFKVTQEDVDNAYKAGQLSKQSKIDDLELTLSQTKQVLNNVIEIEVTKNKEKDSKIEKTKMGINDFAKIIREELICDEAVSNLLLSHLKRIGNILIDVESVQIEKP